MSIPAAARHPVVRLDELRGKLAARKGKPEYAENVKALEAEIARLEAQIAADDAEAAGSK